MRRHVFISQVSQAHIYITLIEWTDVWDVSSGGLCDGVAELGIYPSHTPAAAGGAAHGDSMPNWYESVIFL